MSSENVGTVFNMTGGGGSNGGGGSGIPAGGTTDQVLTKKSAADFDAEWKNPPASGVTSFNGRTGAVAPQSGDYTAGQVGTLPITGGTLTGNLTLKGSGNFGMQLNFGDGDFVHIAEPTDDCMEIKAKKLNLLLSDDSDEKLTINGKPLADILGIGGGVEVLYNYYRDPPAGQISANNSLSYYVQDWTRWAFVGVLVIYLPLNTLPPSMPLSCPSPVVVPILRSLFQNPALSLCFLPLFATLPIGSAASYLLRISSNLSVSQTKHFPNSQKSPLTTVLVARCGIPYTSQETSYLLFDSRRGLRV